MAYCTFHLECSLYAFQEKELRIASCLISIRDMPVGTLWGMSGTRIPHAWAEEAIHGPVRFSRPGKRFNQMLKLFASCMVRVGSFRAGIIVLFPWYQRPFRDLQSSIYWWRRGLGFGILHQGHIKPCSGHPVGHTSIDVALHHSSGTFGPSQGLTY